MKKLSFPLFALAALAASPPYVHAATPSYVSAEQTRIMQILPAPPAADSAVTRDELALLHRLQDSRTAQQAALAVADDQDESIFIYRDVLGERFNAARLPVTAAFSARVNNDEEVNTLPAKQGFHRMRPYNLDKTLQPICKTKTKDDSYPSGHTTAGYLQALALIELVPEKRDAILARAADYGNNRLVCGVHYPSDLQASKVLAYSVHAVMANNPQYQKEMEAARSEVRKALGLPATSAN